MKKEEKLDRKDVRFFKTLFVAKKPGLDIERENPVNKDIEMDYYGQKLDRKLNIIKSNHDTNLRQKALKNHIEKAETFKKEFRDKFRKNHSPGSEHSNSENQIRTELENLTKDQRDVANSKLRAQKKFLRFMENHPEVFKVTSISDSRKRLASSPFKYCAFPSHQNRPDKKIFELTTVRVNYSY